MQQIIFSFFILFVASHNKLHIYRFHVPRDGTKNLVVNLLLDFFAKKVFSYMSYRIIIEYLPNLERIYRNNIMIDLESMCT